MKEHLKNITRKANLTDKSQFDYVLSQNEKNFSGGTDIFNTFLSRVTSKTFSFYPNTENLKDRLANLYKVKKDNLLLTPGSDIAIKTVFESFDLKGKNIITTDYCFPMYEVYAEIYQANLIKVPYTSMKTDIQGIINAINKETAFVIIASPNSPLGDNLEYNDLKPLLRTGVPTLVDEAYKELAFGTKFTEHIEEFKNLIVTRTLSKGYGAAGIRVGTLIANLEYMKTFNALRLMYEVTGPSVVYAECMLDNLDRLKADIDGIKTLKRKLVKSFTANGYNIVNTDCTWFFLEKTISLESTFQKYKVDIRTLKLPNSKKDWYKFNVDLILNKSPLLNELLPDSI